MRYLKSVTMAVAGAVAMAALPAGAFQDEGTVRIGSTEPLTGPGAVYGQPNIVGKFIAVDEINAAGGIMIDGKQVKIDLISEDDQAKPRPGRHHIPQARRQGSGTRHHRHHLQPGLRDHVGPAPEEARRRGRHRAAGAVDVVHVDEGGRRLHLTLGRSATPVSSAISTRS